MAKSSLLRHIYIELKEHAPFTFFGAILGVAFMLLFRNLSQSTSHTLFTIFHPSHIVLSAMTTAAMFKIHRAKTNFIIVLIIGIVGAIGIATVSDSVIPFIGGKFLNLNIPTHQDLHAAHDHSSDEEHPGCTHETDEHGSKIYLGFIEEWPVVYPAAILGVVIAWFYPRTKFPHAGHVLISTWASSAYILMTAENTLSVIAALAMVLILFISTWLPCCVSDIIFPLLLTGQPHSCSKCKKS